MNIFTSMILSIVNFIIADKGKCALKILSNIKIINEF
jgi:hypothetical protein